MKASNRSAQFCVSALLYFVMPNMLVSQSWFDRDRVVEAEAAPDGSLIAYTLRHSEPTNDRFIDQLFIIPAGGGGDPWFLADGGKAAFAPVGEAIAWLSLSGGVPQLVVRDSLGGVDRVLTTNAGGVAAFRWAPDGSSIVFATAVGGVHGAGQLFVGGDRNSQLALHLVPSSGGPTRRLTDDGFRLGPANPELPNLIEFDWLNDTTLIVSGRVSNGAAHPEAASLYLLNVSAGSTRYFMGEGGRWHTPVVSPNGDWVAFTGQAVGAGPWNAAELLVVSADGAKINRLTVGLDRDVHDIHWESNSRHLWFATEDRGTRNLHRIDSRNGKVDRQTSGTHLLALESLPRRGGWALAVQSSGSTAGTLIRFPLNKPHELMELVVPDSGAAASQFEEFQFRSRDGIELSAQLLRTPQFDPAQQYPLLVDIHGGPHAMAGAGYAPFAFAHAALGRLVLRVNGRGSTGFGFDIANGLNNKWPGTDVADIQDAITALVGVGMVDVQQISVVGHGAGGVIAEVLRQVEPRINGTVLRCTGTAALSGSGVPDRAPWHEWTASRPFLQLAGLWLSRSPLNNSASVSTPLLIIEGSQHQPGGMEFGSALHGVAGGAGVPVSFLRVAGGCSDAGPTTQAALINTEDRWLNQIN